MNIMMLKSMTRLWPQQYGIRSIVTAAKKVDIFEEMKTYPFLKTFLYESEDPVKQKWELVQSWSQQCQNNPEITPKQLKVLRQRYELKQLYDDESISENNTFLKQMYEQIKDVENQTNLRTLSDAQFDVTKRILTETAARDKFIAKVPELMNEYKTTIDTLQYRKFNYEQFEKGVVAWATYKFLSFAHPRAIQLYQIMVKNDGYLSAEEFKDVIHFMKQYNGYSYENKQFKDAMKWLSRMNLVFDHPFAEKGIYDKHIKDYFKIIFGRYSNLKSVLEDEDTLIRCKYSGYDKKEGKDQEFEPEVKDIELWLQKLSKKGNDELFVWLKDNLNDSMVYAELQDAIVNRFQLDIGGLLDEHSDVLIPILNNVHLYNFAKEEIGGERQRILRGKQLNPEYIQELREMVKTIQNKFNQEKLKAL